MKKVMFALALLLVVSTAFSNLKSSDEVGKASRALGVSLIEALQQKSFSEYLKLFPTLEEFHTIMDANASIYGSFLVEAKNEFAKMYIQQLVPALQHSFDSLIKEGNKKNINWSQVQIVRVEHGDSLHQPIVIVISSKGNEHVLIIDRACLITDQIKISQFVKLI